MKKIAIFALAALLVVAFTVPVSALENKFGGYFRVRAFTNQNFTGEDVTEAQDQTRTDTRTRLYYTAILNDNLKLVNKFEMDAVFGDQGYGDIGADGVSLEVKNSYADFTMGAVNVKAGVQGGTIARGFVFSDDFAGLNIAYKGEGVTIPFIWIKAYEGSGAAVVDANDMDFDYYALAPSFSLGEGISINPYFLWATTDDASGWANARFVDVQAKTEIDAYYLGLDVDLAFGPASIWLTGIYNGGEIEPANGAGTDIAAFLFAIGGKYAMDMFDIHGEFFYASGDDNAADTDYENYVNAQGHSYYWSEIMGLGVFDAQASNNSPGDQITNIMAVNIGAGFKPMDDLKVALDLWYATRAEEIVANQDEALGTEVDLKITYQLVEGLNLDVIGAILFADDTTTNNSANDANPWELGSRISLSF